jgi:transposase
MKILKQVVAADVDQRNLVVTLGRLNEDLSTQLYAHKVFANDKKGFTSLVNWVDKFTARELSVHFVMEATGVYHESFAYFLDLRGELVSVVLSNVTSNYRRTLELKTITDKTSSEVIARLALSRNLLLWHRPDAALKKLKQLTRERDQIVGERVLIKNQLHAEKAEAEPNQTSLSRMLKRIALLNKQEKEIQSEIQQMIRLHPGLKEEVNLICSIPGVGTLTAVTVLAETNGFDLIRNKRQLTSYAGLDVKEKQSGTSVKGKPKISKRGNRYLRKALYMPALAAIRSNERYKTVFARLVAKHGIKMKAAVAVQRKLLELMYIVHKSKTPYQHDYQLKCADLINQKGSQSITINHPSYQAG